MNKHPDCKNECQQAVDYGVWPERSCSPLCVYLRRHERMAGEIEYDSWPAVARSAGAAVRCPLCGYQHGHAIGCANNPVDIALADGVPASKPKLCNYCGVVVDSGMVCTTDGEFNHCPNKQIGEAIGGVSVDRHDPTSPRTTDGGAA